MKINQIKGLPNIKQERFLKVNFKSLFEKEFEKVERLEIKRLDEKREVFEYNSKLFDIVKTIDGVQKSIVISEDTSVPMMLVHVIDGDNLLLTNSLHIHVKKDVNAKIVDIVTDDCENSAICINRLITLEEGAKVEYLKLQDISKTNSLLYNAQIEQGENSEVFFTNLDYGNGFIVNNFINEINSQNVDYNLSGFAKLINNSNCSNLIKTIHNAQNSTSNITYKHTLKDKAYGVFKALSIVNEKAVFTKAYQNCHNILLSDEAVIYAEPHLEIFIDELEASHGATTGSLDKDQLLYLQSRGISKEKSLEMVLSAFEKEVIEAIRDEKLKEVARKYNRSDYV